MTRVDAILLYTRFDFGVDAAKPFPTAFIGVELLEGALRNIVGPGPA